MYALKLTAIASLVINAYSATTSLDPAASSTVSSIVDELFSVLPNVANDFLAQLEDRIDPTAAVSDLPPVFSSIGSELRSVASEVRSTATKPVIPEALLSSAASDALQQLSSLESQLPASLKLSELAAFVSTATGLTIPTVSYGQGTVAIGGNTALPTETASMAITGTGSILTPNTASASATGSSAPASTGGAAVQAVRWKRALACVVGAAAFL